MKIAILDDQKEILEIVKQLFERYIIDYMLTIDTFLITDEKSLPQDNYDMYVIDIEMPINGFQFAKQLSQNKKVVFISAYDTLVYSSFLYNPYFFLRKKELKKDIQALMNKLNLNENTYTLSDEGIVQILKINDIMKITSEENYIRFTMCNHKTYLQRLTFNEIIEDSRFNEFMLVRRGVFLNINYISQLTDSIIHLNDGSQHSVARARKKDVQNKYNQWRINQYVK